MLLLKVVARIVLLAAVAAAVFGVYLVKRVDFGSFRDGIEEGIEKRLAAEVREIGGIRRDEGALELGRVVIAGGEESFFDEAWLRAVRTKMGMVAGVLTPWDGEVISIDVLAIKLRAGAESDGLGRRIYERVLAPEEGFQFSRIEVANATVTWGYSAGRT